MIDIDATLVGAHSDKEQAAPTWKRGFGFHPLLAYLDATGEALAGVLRPGNAGSGTATDHVRVLADALAQLPLDPAEREVIVRADSAGWSHGFVEECRDRHVRFVIGHQLTVEIASVLVNLPKRAWQPAISADGSDWRDHAEVAEITHLVSDVFDATRAWPSGLRMIARREQPHPGAQLTFTDVDGHRYQVFVTDLADTDIAYLEALYRGRGRAERQICDTKATGLTNLPSHSFADQPRLAATRALRPRPVGLVPTPRTRRHQPRQRGTETTPLLPVPHRRPHHPHQPTNHLPARRQLALDPRPRHRVRPRSPTPAALLNNTTAAHRRPQHHRAGQPTPPTRRDLTRPCTRSVRPRPPDHDRSAHHSRPQATTEQLGLEAGGRAAVAALGAPGGGDAGIPVAPCDEHPTSCVRA